MPFRRTRSTFLVLSTALLALLALAPAALAATWSTWGNSPARTGRATSSQLTAGNASKLVKAWSTPLGAVVDGQPLYAGNVQTVNGPVDLYLVATEAGSVFALDAATGKVVWRSELGSVHLGCAQLPGGVYGATGAMTYDASHLTLYAVSTNQLWALDVRTGKPETGWPLTLPFDPRQLHAWGALSQLGSSVYVPTASYCDHPPSKGGLIRVDVTTQAITPWYPVPVAGPAGGGSVWGWGGAAIDPATGEVWAATGNAIPNAALGIPNDNYENSDSLVALSPDLTQVLAASQPPNIPPVGDYDFGATPLLFRPTGCPPLVAALNKDGDLYLWRRDQVAKGPYQTVSLAFPAGLFGVPAWNSAAGMLYLTTTAGYHGYHSGLQAFRVGAGCRLQHVWTRALGSTLDSAPTIANNTVSVATGTGHLRIFTATTGAPLANLSLGLPMFVPPVTVGRDVAVTGWTRTFTVFRLPGG
jgi:outer membrane protein assembly factor BamB